MIASIALRALVASLVLILSAAALPVLAKSSANRISSISPTAAQRGELVTITGFGFGAGKLQVTVANVAAELVSATGDRATFRVPKSAPFGSTTVQVRNPGGQTGSIAFEVLGGTPAFDGNVEVEADVSAAVSAAIGSDANEIEVEGMTLEIPAGVLPEGTKITLTPLRRLVGSPFAGAPVGVLMEPSGLVLLQPATLTLPRPAGAAPEDIVTFGFDKDGDSFHPVPHVLSEDAIEILVWHFSGAGAVVATAAQLAAVASYTPTAAHQRAEREIAVALANISMPEDLTKLSLGLTLLVWYDGLLPNLQASANGSLESFELAFSEWQAWLANVALYINPPYPDHEAILTQITVEAAGVALAAARTQALRLLDLCTGASGIPTSALRNVIRLANVVNLVSMPIETGSVPKASNLPSACVRVVIVNADHANTFAVSRDNRLRVDAQVAFRVGSPSTTIPLRFKLVDTTDGANQTLVSELDSDGHWETNVRPTTLGVRQVDLEVSLGEADTDDVLKSLSDLHDIDVEARARLELQGQRAGDSQFTDSIDPVDTGASVTLRIRLAGDNTKGAVVTLSHDGDGTLPPNVTTNDQGEATFTYTAPQTAGTDGITATLADGAQDSLQVTSRLPPVTHVAFRSPPVGQYLNAGGTTSLCVDVTDGDDKILANVPVAWSLSGPGSIPSPSTLTGASGISCTDYMHPGGPVLESITAIVSASATADGAVGSDSVKLLPRWARITLEVRSDSSLTFVGATNSTVSMEPTDGARIRLTLTGPGATASDPVVPLADGSVGLAITTGGGLLLDSMGNPVGPFTALNLAGQAIITFDPNGSTGDTELRFFNPADGSPGIAATVTLDRTHPPVVILTPLRPSLGFGQTRQFTATIANLANQDVTWSATGGTINQGGKYTAGSTAGVFAVTATSVADPTASTSTEVQVTVPTIDGLYAGSFCFTSIHPDNPFNGCFELPPFYRAWVIYTCGTLLEKNVGPGTVCGWGDFPATPAVPTSAGECQIDTDGTLAGGAFIGTISYCNFGLNETHAATRIEGTIGDGNLKITVFGPDPSDGAIRAIEHYDLYKTF